MSIDRDNVELYERISRLEEQIRHIEDNITVLRDDLKDHQDKERDSMMEWFSKSVWFILGIAISILGYLIVHILL